MSNKAKGSSLQAGERSKLKQGGGARSAAVKGIQPATIKKVPVLHRTKDLTVTPAHTHYDSDSFPGDPTGLSKSATVTRLERELVVSSVIPPYGSVIPPYGSVIPPYGSEVFHSCSHVLQELKRENSVLKKELADIKYMHVSVCIHHSNISIHRRALHEQLIHESLQENFSEKRVNLLKSQLFQLERQVMEVFRSSLLGIANISKLRI